MNKKSISRVLQASIILATQMQKADQLIDILLSPNFQDSIQKKIEKYGPEKILEEELSIWKDAGSMIMQYAFENERKEKAKKVVENILEPYLKYLNEEIAKLPKE